MENSQNTVDIIVAALMAFAAFVAALNPPGGVYGDGKEIVGNSVAFKVFVVTNGVALFLLLCLVAVLVGFVPFKRKQPLVELMRLAKLVMWVAVSAMGSAYLAVMWLIVPRNHGGKWSAVGLLAVLCVLWGFTLIFMGSLGIDSLLKGRGRR